MRNLMKAAVLAVALAVPTAAFAQGAGATAAPVQKKTAPATKKEAAPATAKKEAAPKVASHTTSGTVK